MRYFSVTEVAKKWSVSECSVRNYCAQGGLVVLLLLVRHGIFLRMRKISSKKRSKKIFRTLLNVFKDGKENKLHGGIYHKT